jgi:hypothetical protein
MIHRKNNGVKDTQKQNLDSKPAVTDFGTRKISNQNKSKILAIPKTALENCGCKNPKSANVQLVQEGDEKYIKLTPLDCTPVQKEVKKDE